MQAEPAVSASEQMLLSECSGSTCLLYSLHREGRRMLLKRLLPQYQHDVRMREVFSKEFDTGRRIHSPYLVEYISLEDDDQGLGILMEYVDGQTMADVLAKQPEWFARDGHLLRFFDQLLQAIQTLHHHQVLHLDLKPDNVMLTRVSSDVKVIDLGYCYSDTYYATTGRNRVYAAPEQLDASGHPDVRADLYAAGRMLDYACRRAGLKVGRSLQRVITTATQPDPAQRYDSADAMRQALHRALDPVGRRLLLPCALLLVSAVMLTLAYILAHRSDPRQVDLDEYRYTLLSDDSLTCSVDRYICDWPIPNPQHRCIYSPLPYQGRDYRVVQVGDSLFCRDSIVQTVAIPEGVVRLGAALCMESQYLRSVSLPSTLRIIGYDAFAGCEALSSIMLPAGLQSIGHNAFVGTRSLSHLTIPAGIRDLPQDCFAGSGICSITLSDSLEVLERGVFYACNRLRRIVLPATLRHVGDYCFYGCDSLTEVVALNVVPIALNDVFATTDTTLSRTLYVPAQSLERYRTAPHWRDFDHILPLTP